MTNLLGSLKSKVLSAIKGKEKVPEISSEGIDNQIALGVLLWAVADADAEFLPQESEKIQSILRSYIRIRDEDMPIILNTIEIAAIERIDLQRFTKEVGKDIPMDKRIRIIEDLFRVACADSDLAHEEHETIRQISKLLWVEHKDFIDAKLRIKKEFGLPTAD